MWVTQRVIHHVPGLSIGMRVPLCPLNQEKQQAPRGGQDAATPLTSPPPLCTTSLRLDMLSAGYGVARKRARPTGPAPTAESAFGGTAHAQEQAQPGRNVRCCPVERVLRGPALSPFRCSMPHIFTRDAQERLNQSGCPRDHPGGNKRLRGPHIAPRRLWPRNVAFLQ